MKLFKGFHPHSLGVLFIDNIKYYCDVLVSMAKKTIAVTIDPEMDDKLIAESKKEHRSKSSMVNLIMAKYFEK